MNEIAILIVAHKPIKYYELLARHNPTINFIVHMDKKISYINPNIENLIFLEDHLRVDVKWGGFSQVKAMLNLLSFSINHTDSNFFHLVSGEDILISKDKSLVKSLMWENGYIFMDLKNSLKHRFRVRFFAPHVETFWQRKFIGKVFTFSLKILDKILFTKKDFWFGSNWFSIHRNELKKILDLAENKDMDFFKYRLNPDEHFFQYLVVKAGLLEKLSPLGNNRYIVFDKNYNNGNNPIYLGFEELLSVKRDNNPFFARKVDAENQLKYYERVNLE
ncbi:beta-1,6-N-acetylglucosaminyltransferase [Acinetobacter gyllenbergii]|uniref:beta-1,6-N-acetylglucosaminyltransferase n=1 Tax=Acinetobacter gyllenbergii TaxID=134534 RepID=UPI0021D2B497|nr:beta-1,6-N-acetylglucosaminyltransferase [Acinetobacter gyllenbergii]MCU4582037.1 beta-1,6-N-acetylglucosaminyltransferase [Acinetobacter gyllenbergii]